MYTENQSTVEIVRRMLASDVVAVGKIEKHSPSPWSVNDIANELELENRLTLVATATTNTTLCGWCTALLHEKEAELLKIAVSPPLRNCGCASTLLNRIEEECRSLSIEMVFLEVRSRNIPANSFYRKMGYGRCGIRKTYYSSPIDDALVYSKRLNQKF